MSYTVRRGLFERPVTWRLAPGMLIATRDGVETLWPLEDLRLARLSSGASRYLPNARVLTLSFRKGRASIGSHTFQGVARYFDQGEAFSQFVRATCAEAAACAPTARFEGGASRPAGVFAGAAAILGMGVVLLLVGTIAAGAVALGAELAARFAFALILLFAAWPWLPGVGVRAFDPEAISDDLLP